MDLENKKNKIKKILKEIEHPEIASTLFGLGMLKDINAEENKVTLSLNLPMPGIPIKDYLINDIESAVKKENPDIKVEINIAEMNEEERTKFFAMAQGAWRG